MRTSYLNDWNADLLDEYHQRWKKDPASVDSTWSAFFEGFELGLAPTRNGKGAVEVPAPVGLDAQLRNRIDSLVNNYRILGHTQAKLDPLSDVPPEQPALALKEFGLEETSPNTIVSSRYFRDAAPLPFGELLKNLRATYSDTIGIEFMHIQDRPKREWLRQKMEARVMAPPFDPARQKQYLRWLMEAETFEQFVHTKFIGQKRFSLQGGESLMIILETILNECPGVGVQEIVMGMAHRGRLTVLANFLKKSYDIIFKEFSENYVPDLVAGDGDVKYHLGYESIREIGSAKIGIRLAANPSHLEIVNPVVEGNARARQRILGDIEERKKVLPLLLHGDAAFAGQGIVAEVLNLSQLAGYETGGTVHVIVNNQIGFTTLPADARSTMYCTDVAKMIEAPIFHVNGDDPLAVAFAAQTAFEFRQKYGCDVVVDMYCYRRYGHNETDEPSFTQPKLYKTIHSHPAVTKIFKERMLQSGVLTTEEAEALENEFRGRLESALTQVRSSDTKSKTDLQRRFEESSAIFQPAYSHEEPDTRVRAKEINHIVDRITQVPDGFRVQPQIRKMQLERRKKQHAEGGPFDWSYAEALAFGSLLIEGTPVRLSGQDSRRGTFSQRHSVLYDVETRERYIPLANLSLNQARFCVYNSMLSEAAVLGFDYGYSLDFPDMLCLWEAQFGDFANGAQVIIDQFIASSESKWQRPSGIVLLLPHGYEGQGPEHSSARLERFLQLCAEENMQVCNLTTPSQYFHVLRRQVRRDFRKPLILMSPKSLLRSERAVSRLADFTDSSFQPILPPTLLGKETEVDRLIFSTGKVYYDLLSYLEANQVKNTALIRIEQLYPLHLETLIKVIGRFLAASKWIWCQEEPK
ncbi:MAG TPA: 2-oxoglutarate dehydrogenase E1 component, partial [Chthoniobacterales bacterium]|nr:2-oxoglutarate dehydrogenase E1 component [Chthoniobacterales bacterium]